MRFTLAQLRKLQMPYKVFEKLDLSADLDNFEDIIRTSNVEVNYEIRERGLDTYLVTFNFKVELIMQCSISLKEVPFTIEGNAEELFSTNDNLEDVFLIEGQTLDTYEAVLTNVLINKPMTVVAEGVDFESDEEPEEDTQEEKINPAFAKLKDLL